IDLPGNVSPPPGMSFAADDTLVAYLTARGVRFVAFVKSEQSKGPYRRWMWEGMIGSPLWSAAAPRYLQAFSRFESLPASHARLYDDGEMVLVDLGAAQRCPPIPHGASVVKCARALRTARRPGGEASPRRGANRRATAC